MNTADVQVTVTGATGFIALHCIAQLLAAGYHVRGTVRDAARAEEVRKALSDVHGVERLQLVPASLLADEGWAAAMRGSRFVLHTASPVPARQPRDESEVVAPARDGTLRVLSAASAAGVERVVVTSSIAAVLSGHPRTARTFTEDDWSDLAGAMPAYSRSKTLAEQAAWSFVAQQPPERRLELVTINPAFVIGPSRSGVRNASNEIVRKLVARELPGVPRLMFSLVDVRDVADAHVRAMTMPGAAGQRFIVSEGEYWYVEIARMLAEAGHAVPTRVVPDWVVRVVGWFDPTVRLVVDRLGHASYVSAARARAVLGWTTRDMRETLRETADRLTARRA